MKEYSEIKVFGRRRFPLSNSQGGILLALVLTLGILLFFLAIGFFRFSGQQNALAHTQRYGEMARFLAESGIEIARETLRQKLRNHDENSQRLRQWLLSPQLAIDAAIDPYLAPTLQEALDDCAKKLDPTAILHVRLWLSAVEQTEIDPAKWADPAAKNVWFHIEATGQCRGSQSVLTTRNRLSVANCLPPVYSKFTLHVANSSPKSAGYFNVVRNDDLGKILPGPHPLFCFNHTTPGNPINEPESFAEEADPNVFQKRGWIFLGGGANRLNLTAGRDNAGELFFFRNVHSPNATTSGVYTLDPSEFPPSFPRTLSAYWDRLGDDAMKRTSYQLGHHYTLEGFYDKSENKPTEAMYASGIFSEKDRETSGSRSSLLHLFGDARPDFRSRTRVFGNVSAAVPKVSNLEVVPLDPEIEKSFQAEDPPPQYHIPSMSEDDFDPSAKIIDILNRHFGGPTLTVEDLAPSFSDFKPLRSEILEVPYTQIYNCIQEVLRTPSPLRYPPPPSQESLQDSDGIAISLRTDDRVMYEGGASPAAFLEIVEGRVQHEVLSIGDFQRKYFDKDTNTLRLESVVRILNPDKANLILPFPGTTGPLRVSGRGMVILEQGNLILRGVSISAPSEALTVVLAKGEDVFIGSMHPNYVNVAAPFARLHATDPFILYGTLAVKEIPVTTFPGGAIHYRESQNPTGLKYSDYYIIDISEREYPWHG